VANLASSVFEAPEAEENQDRDDADRTIRGRHQLIDIASSCTFNDFTSSSTSLQRTAAEKAPVLEEDIEYFDLLAS
jgi:hypothetical protein